MGGRNFFSIVYDIMLLLKEDICESRQKKLAYVGALEGIREEIGKFLTLCRQR
jgi:hypothetical protein